MVTLDQIEKWKRDSEILTEIDEKLDRYHKTVNNDPSCDKCGKIVDERSLDFNLAIGFVCQTCREELE